LSNNRLVAALVAGFVATHVATVSGYWFHGINLPDLGWPNFNGLLLGTEASPLAQFWAGTVYHTFTGIAFALLFAFLVHPKLPLPNTRSGNIWKALIFGAILATLSADVVGAAVVNQVFQTDLGRFSQNVGQLFGTSAWKPIVGIYRGTRSGAVLGLMQPEGSRRRVGVSSRRALSARRAPP
jgi:hypothetical protein